MKTAKLSAIVLGGALLALTACEDSITPGLLNDNLITADVANSSGDAIATAIKDMVDNESQAALPGSLVASNMASLNANSLNYARTRTCYDINNAVVANCSPVSSVRKIVTHVEINGTRSGTNETQGGAAQSWSGKVVRVLDDTLVRNFNGSTEVSRTHSGVMRGNDTTTFTQGEFSRRMSEASRDTVKAVTWNLPRANNPFPVSGSIVRTDTVEVVLTRGDRTESRQVLRRIQVNFPADAQGNVVLMINDKTCNLNLVTHRVSNCS